jgi:hypothetical protein
VRRFSPEDPPCREVGARVEEGVKPGCKAQIVAMPKQLPTATPLGSKPLPTQANWHQAIQRITGVVAAHHGQRALTEATARRL